MSENNSPPQDLIQVEGILEPTENKSGILLDLSRGGKTTPHDPFVPRELLRRFKLRKGSHLTANATSDNKYGNPKVRFIETVDGLSINERKIQFRFDQLTTIQPKEKLTLEVSDGRMTSRIIDMFCPIGKGQRALIVAPPRTGKTTILHDIAKGVEENHPECHLMVLLVDERPEEVTDFRRSVPAEIYASSNDEEVKNHLRVAELAIERAKRLVETGKDVVLLLDSITRLSRAYNAATGKGGRTMTGGLDARALEKPRQIFSAARNSEEAGSLTIVATALVETGSKMDELIFQEFKGTGNSEIVLDRKVAELRLWPAINLAASGTRKEEDLLSPEVLEKSSFVRRAMAPMKIADAAETLIERMEKTADNKEFLKLITTA
ncbi:MAG: transcription termination factor Rho [Verrucomicrobia bacterium]|nr:transcription termination factor Rho [Verrucomicrobiota bacterium]MDA0722790.1 transcription termination factor Rho [Verrucomicrobiota bacterium]MDA1045631.1 transcription termination factor Rho [Verrucomicrobiota bacterium]